MRDEVQKWREMWSGRLSLLWYSIALRTQQEKRQQQVKSARASPLAFSSIASQPRRFSYTPKMATNAKCAFCVAMALSQARQATGEILTGKSGLPELALLLLAWSPVGPVAPPRSVTHVSLTNLSRVWKLATLLLVLRYYEHLFLFSMLKHVTSSRFCLYLLNIYHFTYTFSHAHTEPHTHKHTCTISTQEEWRQPGTGAWLREAGERLLLKTLQQQKKNVRKKTDIHESKEKIRAHRASSKATRLFVTK